MQISMIFSSCDAHLLYIIFFNKKNLVTTPWMTSFCGRGCFRLAKEENTRRRRSINIAEVVQLQYTTPLLLEAIPELLKFSMEADHTQLKQRLTHGIRSVPDFPKKGSQIC